MAKKMSVMNIVTTKIGLITAIAVVILGAIFLRSSYELVRMFLLDMLMGLGITNEYWQHGILILIVGIVLFLIAKDKLKGMLK